MSRCARCGRPIGDDYNKGECAVAVAGDECEGALLPATVACREAELANLHSLLRSVTIKLEKAHQLCTDDYPKSAAGLIEQVLETLS